MSWLTRRLILARILKRRIRAFLGKGWLSERTPLTVRLDDFCDNPIFIIGCHRSGTSLVRRILDSHSNIACPPESFYLQHFTPLLEDSDTFVGLDGMGIGREEGLRGFRHCAGFFHEIYRESKNKRRWADKTPQYAFHLRTLHQLYGDAARFVFVLRHPLDVAYSIWNRGWFKTGEADYLSTVTNYVRDSLERQVEFLEHFPQISFRADYVDVVHTPEPILKRLCAFLNEPWDPAMLQHHLQPHDFGTEDPMVRGTPGFVTSEENWKAWSDAQQDKAWSVLKQIATRLGYDRGSAAPESSPSRLVRVE